VNECKIQMLIQPTIESHHDDISTNECNDVAHCEYKFLYVYENMSTYDPFQEKHCEDNAMKEPSAVEEPRELKDTLKEPTIIVDLVNDEALESTTLGSEFFSQDDVGLSCSF